MDLRTVLVDRGPLGGQLHNTELIEDYPGIETILGPELALKMGDHARKFGLDAREYEPVTSIDVDGEERVVKLDSGNRLRGPAVVMAARGRGTRAAEPATSIDVDGEERVGKLDSGNELRAPAVIMAAGGLPKKLEVP